MAEPVGKYTCQGIVDKRGQVCGKACEAPIRSVLALLGLCEACQAKRLKRLRGANG